MMSQLAHPNHPNEQRGQDMTKKRKIRIRITRKMKKKIKQSIIKQKRFLLIRIQLTYGMRSL